MSPDPRERPDDDDQADHRVRDALSAFNAEEILDDPDELEPEQPHRPAATPDSPNPI